MRLSPIGANSFPHSFNRKMYLLVEQSDLQVPFSSLMDKLRKSFKSDQRHPNHPEERQILLNQSENPMASQSTDLGDRKDVVIKITGKENSKQTEIASQSPSPSQISDRGSDTTGKMWGDSSYDFSNDVTLARVAREFDFTTDSPLSQRSPLSRIPESPNYGQVSPREVRVSFNETTTESVRRRSNAGAELIGGEQQEVLVCSSNSSFRQKSSWLRTKSKSRLMDPPEDQRSQRLMKSGMIGKVSEIDEDDPFLEEDLPDEYKTMKFSTLALLQWVSLILIIAALVCSIAIPFLRRKTIFELELWKWELMILVLICGRLVSGWGIRIVVFFIERNFLLRKRVLYFVYGLRNAVQNCIWLGLVLIAWQCIFDKKVERMTDGMVLPYVTKIWVCLLVGTLIWLLKTLLVKVLASSFHVNTFFDRIQESLFNQYVIETLSGPPLIEIEEEQEEEERVMVEVQKLQNAGATIPADLRANLFPRSGKGTPQKSPMSATGTTNTKSPRFSRVNSKKEKDEERIKIDHLHRLNQKNISAWNMKRLMNIVRKGVLSTLDEQLQESTTEDESAVQITNENQAKAAAKKIFCNVSNPGSKHIYLNDLMRFMRDDEALKTLHLFEGASESKGISKRVLKNWVH
ncbi:unnamed protein product [Ilex paraguariensis]|uniref:Mechanosensitive ion channel protein n=1 Tax=Ilex paraguariensis TaxID=185542 RepID=A0ABC8UAG6_9AQUA